MFFLHYIMTRKRLQALRHAANRHDQSDRHCGRANTSCSSCYLYFADVCAFVDYVHVAFIRERAPFCRAHMLSCAAAHAALCAARWAFARTCGAGGHAGILPGVRKRPRPPLAGRRMQGGAARDSAHNAECVSAAGRFVVALEPASGIFAGFGHVDCTTCAVYEIDFLTLCIAQKRALVYNIGINLRCV